MNSLHDVGFIFCQIQFPFILLFGRIEEINANKKITMSMSANKKKRNKIMIIYLKRNIFFEMLIYNGVIKFVTDKIPNFLIAV